MQAKMQRSISKFACCSEAPVILVQGHLRVVGTRMLAVANEV